MFWFPQMLTTEKKPFWPIGNLFSFSTEKYWRKKIIDLYSENWWKHFVSSILDASFCVECFCHITESKANQFLGIDMSAVWSYPWGYGSNDQYIVITGKFLTLMSNVSHQFIFRCLVKVTKNKKIRCPVYLLFLTPQNQF